MADLLLLTLVLISQPERQHLGGVLTALCILRATELTATCLFQNVCKAVEETQHPPTIQEIKQKIDSYNSREKHCLGMKLVSRTCHPYPASFLPLLRRNSDSFTAHSMLRPSFLWPQGPREIA